MPPESAAKISVSVSSLSGLGPYLDLGYLPGVGTYGGLRVSTNPCMIESETRTVRRSWRQRLFSRPWRPWVRTKDITVQVPSRTIYQLGSSLVMHPQMWEMIKEELRKEE